MNIVQSDVLNNVINRCRLLHSKKISLFAILFSFVFPVSPDAAQNQHDVAPKAAVELTSLKTNGLINPIGIDTPNPTFSWVAISSERNIKQEAYQVQVFPDAGQSPLWDSGKVKITDYPAVIYNGADLQSKQRYQWQVRTWDGNNMPSAWSHKSSFEMGLLHSSDWDGANWIEHPSREPTQPLPVFAHKFNVNNKNDVVQARLYIASVGVSVETLNGKPVTADVLAPGDTNQQETIEYRSYDITSLLQSGSNTIGVELGNGTAFSHRIPNKITGRNDPYARLTGTTAEPTKSINATTPGTHQIQVMSIDGFAKDQTINIDTGNGGDNLESRTVIDINKDSRTIIFQPELSKAHAAGIEITRSGTKWDADLRITPRFIAKVEILKKDGSVRKILSDRSWKTALGATTSDNWFSGSDYDARLEQPGWNMPDANLGENALRYNGEKTGWQEAGFSAAPNLKTKLASREAEPIRIVDTFIPIEVVETASGRFRVDFNQAFAGFVELNVPPGIPPGTTIRLTPGEKLNPDGTFDQWAMIEGNTQLHGTQVFHTYTTRGAPYGEVWRPQFNYDGFQYIEITGLPDGVIPTADWIRGLQTAADVPRAGSVTTDNYRINRIHRMSLYSIMSNMQSIFTDCPNREKAGWLADMIQSMPAIEKHFDMRAYLQGMMRAMDSSQIKEGENKGYIPSTVPNDQLRSPAQDIGDDINWAGAIVLTPYALYKNYGDLHTARRYWSNMTDYMDYVRTRRVSGTTGDARFIINNGLGDWAAGEPTPKAVTATSGYYLIANRMAEMAKALGKTEESNTYSQLAKNIKDAYNRKFWNPNLGRYTNGGLSSSESTQAGQAIPLDYGLVSEENKASTLNALVELINAYQPFGGGPHTSGGIVSLGPITRALHKGGRDDVLWAMLQENTRPSYGFFIQPSAAHPNGLTTIPEYWDLRQSQNHMILLQIDEWFTTGIAGIRQAVNSIGYRHIVIDPRPTGTINKVSGSYMTPYGEVYSAWKRSEGDFELNIKIPVGTTANIIIPARNIDSVFESDIPVADAYGVHSIQIENDRVVITVGSGSYKFLTTDSAHQ